jgi:hypothetical protein
MRDEVRSFGHLKYSEVVFKSGACSRSLGAGARQGPLLPSPLGEKPTAIFATLKSRTLHASTLFRQPTRTLTRYV